MDAGNHSPSDNRLGSPTSRRVMVIGLDCAPPELVFERYRSLMPNLSRLMAHGSWAHLRSTAPPITVPAWTCMLSGRDPGELGIYGFRNRIHGSYGQRITTARNVVHPRIWDIAGDAGKHVCVLFVPPTYPPSPVNGELVSCFLTPGSDVPHTYPPALQQELEARFGPYQMDVDDFRSEAQDRIFKALCSMTEQHFATAKHLWQSRKPDLLVMVEMGPDRLHHAFWRFIDPSHPKYPGDNPHADAGARYYAFLDAQVGALVALADAETTIMVVSDHGAQPLQGAIAINEWLQREGYLVLHATPPTPVPLTGAAVDWSKTRAWAEGGYYGRVFLNTAGREPEGCVSTEAFAGLRDEIATKLESLAGPGGRKLKTQALTPEAMYRDVTGFAPDLCVFFDDLAYRAIGSVGHGTLYLEDNDTGPDGCNHAWDGIFVMSGAGAPATGFAGTHPIYDVGPTALGLMGLEAPPDWLGTDRSGRST